MKNQIPHFFSSEGKMWGRGEKNVLKMQGTNWGNELVCLFVFYSLKWFVVVVFQQEAERCSILI